ncbi:MAG: AAA family ATPase [Armatimonadetes bacterium]|nr:AAA family ATPase [Armatimonadota bacterium]
MAGYLQHFGLVLAPFSTAPDPRFAFATRAHEIALLRIQDSVEQRMGVCLLKGEIGTGKSTIAHLLLKSWAQEPERFVVAYLSDPSPYTPAQFLRLLVASFGLDPSRYVETNKALLPGFLIDHYEAGRVVVALLDEAQTISPPNMTTLQLLSNEQTAETKLLQLALFAQPSFDRKLSYQPALRSRIARRGNLDPLIFTDSVALMRHRLRVAGGDFARLFPEALHRPLYNASQGIPRRLCILGDNTLFNAFAHGRPAASPEDLSEAIRDGGFDPAQEKAHA